MDKKSNFIKGLVIKEDSIGENAKLLHILTEENGVLIMKAPGAKKFQSSTHSATSLFTYSEFSFAKGKNGYFTITGGVSISNFFGLRNDVFSYALACYISSVARKVSINDVTSKEILRLVLNCLYALSDLHYSAETIKPIFESKILSLCGFSPDFTLCHSCGSSTDNLYFDLFSYGLICKKCEESLGLSLKTARYFHLTNNAIQFFEFISKNEIKKAFGIKSLLENPQYEKDVFTFKSFCEVLICHILEHEPKTLSFYNQLKRSIKK